MVGLTELTLPQGVGQPTGEWFPSVKKHLAETRPIKAGGDNSGPPFLGNAFHSFLSLMAFSGFLW